MPFTKTDSDFADIDPREVFISNSGDYKYAICEIAEQLAANNGLALEAMSSDQVGEYIDKATELYQETQMSRADVWMDRQEGR
jgi:hypothetical protein